MEVSAKTDIGIQAAFKSLISNIYAQVNQKHVIGATQDNIKITAATQNQTANAGEKKKGGCCN